MRSNSANYRDIFLSGVPLLDLRAPCEFNKGSFPMATNLPLMTDIERQKVGTCYKRYGQDAAIKLGHQLVKGETRRQRLTDWLKFAKANPDNGYLFCFRGGLRSRTVQSWLAEEGVNYPLIEGGYKALRNFLIETTERLTVALPFYIVAGLTGSAKTSLLTQLNNHINLEKIANHRGSSFGRQISPQPAQIDFENQLAIKMLNLEERSAKYIVLEDESRLIGARSTPFSFYEKMCQAPIVMLQETFEFRVQHIFEEYVIEMTENYSTQADQVPLEAFGHYLLTSIDNIKKRLGNELHRLLRQLILHALDLQASTGNLDSHLCWIETLLKQYYDPMYQFQLEKKQPRVIFQGNRQEVTEFFDELHSTR